MGPEQFRYTVAQDSGYGMDMTVAYPDAVPSPPVDVPQEELQRVLDYVAEQERELLAQARRNPEYAQAEQMYDSTLQTIQKREQDLIQKLGRPPDWKEYVLPVLASAYVLRDDPEMFGLVLGASALGYEQWRQSYKNRYMQALLEVQSEKQRVLNNKRLLQNQSLARVRSILSQARMLFNTLSQRQFRELTIRLREQHRNRMSQLQQTRDEQRRKDIAARHYWATYREMERLIRDYPAQRKDIYHRFEPILDEYALAGGLRSIHAALGMQLDNPSIPQVMQATRLIRAAAQLDEFRRNRAGMRGVMIGTYGNPTSFLEALANGDFRAAARTIRDIQTVQDALDTIETQIGFMYDSEDSKSRLISFARALGYRGELSTDDFEQLRQIVEQQIRTVRETMFSGVRPQASDQLSDDMAEALRRATNLPGKSLDEAIELAIENNKRVFEEFVQSFQGEEQNGGGSGGGAGAPESAAALPQQQLQQQTQQLTLYDFYKNGSLQRLPIGFQDATSNRLIPPSVVIGARQVASDVNAPPEVQLRARAIAQTQYLTVSDNQGNTQPLILQSVAETDSSAPLGYANATLHTQSRRYVPTLLFYVKPRSTIENATIDTKRAVGIAQSASFDALQKQSLDYPYALDLAWIQKSGSSVEYNPVLLISRRIKVSDTDGVRVVIAAIPILNARLGQLSDSPEIRKLHLQVESGPGVNGAAQAAHNAVNEFRDFLSYSTNLADQFSNPVVRREITRRFQNLAVVKNGAMVIWSM